MIKVSMRKLWSHTVCITVQYCSHSRYYDWLLRKKDLQALTSRVESIEDDELSLVKVLSISGKRNVAKK